LEEPNFLDKTVAGDEIWHFQHEAGKCQSLLWKSQAIKAKRANVKTVLICCFDMKGIISYKCFPLKHQ
jgi:hypothetical protein